MEGGRIQDLAPELTRLELSSSWALPFFRNWLQLLDGKRNSFGSLVTVRQEALGVPGGSDGTESAHNVEDLGLIAGSGRSPGEGNSNPLQYSCLENTMGRGAWLAIVYGIAKSQT